MQNINIDMLNAIRFFLRGVDVEYTPLNSNMPDDLYNAVAFAQANPVEQFIYTEEFNVAAEEFLVEIVGVWGMF